MRNLKVKLDKENIRWEWKEWGRTWFLTLFHFCGWLCLGLLSLGGGLWATSCLQWTTVSNIMLTYGVKYRNTSFSWPRGWRAQSCSYSCAGEFLNKKPEPDVHQQCAPLCKFAGWSAWWPIIPQESCRFHIILSYDVQIVLPGTGTCCTHKLTAHPWPDGEPRRKSWEQRGHCWNMLSSCKWKEGGRACSVRMPFGRW